MKRGSVWFFIAVLLCVGGAMPAGAQEQLKRTVQVQGQATMEVEPDVAFLSLGVETQADTAAKAQAQLSDRASKVILALAQAGIDKAKIKTSSYEVSPVYSTRQDKQNLIIGYKAETAITVEISDLRALGGVVDTCIAAGANAIGSISYDRKDMESFKELLIRAACEDAAKKAKAAAEALGMRLGPPISIDVQDSFAERESSGMLMMKASTSADFLSPGSREIRAAANIVFELLLL